jgi:hypothetical protein
MDTVQKHIYSNYMLIFIFHAVTVSIQTFIPSLYKFKHSYTVVLLSKGCETPHNYFCNVFRSSNIFLDNKFLNASQR